jgi:regulator of cell morphogenesis and NO signaling
MTDTMPTVGELVAERPARSRVFEEFGIDYCCGGKMPLDEACARRGVAVEEIQQRLAAVEAGGTDREIDWLKAPLSALCNHIVAAHHDRLRRELPRIRELLAKLARVHGGRHPELREALVVFGPFADDLTAHMAKEERVLFPLVARIESREVPPTPEILKPIRVMEAEHDAAGWALGELRRLTNGYAVPLDGCNTYRAAMSALAELEADMHTHVHKENNILFPRVAQLVGDERAGAAG